MLKEKNSEVGWGWPKGVSRAVSKSKGAESSQRLREKPNIPQGMCNESAAQKERISLWSPWDARVAWTWEMIERIAVRCEDRDQSTSSKAKRERHANIIDQRSKSTEEENINSPAGTANLVVDVILGQSK